MTPETRAPRSDAVANREKLLEAAATAFAAEGAAASLKDIARSAGVGIGTLYRHFPTREALIEAAHENELTRLCDSADELLDAGPAGAALRTWLHRWVAYLRTKDGLVQALRASAVSGAGAPALGGVAFPGARVLALQAVQSLLAAAAVEGVVRAGIEPLDVLVAGNGIALAALDADQVERLLDYLLSGLQAHAPAAST